VGVALAAALLATPAAATTGVTLIRHCYPATRPAPGVTYQHCTARLSSMPTADVQDVYTVSWRMGDRRVAIGSALMGAEQTNRSIGIHPISRWARGRHGLIAAENGDFFRYGPGSTAYTTGLLVHGRHVLQFGNESEPLAGYSANGRVQFGHVAAAPQLVKFPQRKTASVAGFGVLPGHGDQVGVYRRTGTVVSIGSSYAAVMLTGDPFSTSLSGSRGWADPTGRAQVDTVGSFVLQQAGAAVLTRSYPVVQVTRSQVRVPSGHVLLVYLKRPTDIAAAGFAAILTAKPASVKVTQPTAAWSAVSDTMAGKPMVVVNGRAILHKPADTTSDQWYAEQWRPAIATTAGGRAAMVVIGTTQCARTWWGGCRSSSTKGAQFGQMLKQLGYSNAIEFDNRSSTELFRPAPNNGSCQSRGNCDTMQWGWERDIPAATVLYRAP
jgi:hypothetical protein